MPLNILLTFIIGTTLGWLFMKITKAPPDMQGLVLGFCDAIIHLQILNSYFNKLDQAIVQSITFL